jgi:hypothetical protein
VYTPGQAFSGPRGRNGSASEVSDSEYRAEDSVVVGSLRVLVLGLLVAAPFPVRSLALAHFDSPSLATITVNVQTFGRPRADFPATIQIHSSSLDNDLSTTSDTPSSLNFPNLPPGDYRVTVTAPSREAVHLDLTLASGQSARMSLILDRIFPLTLNLDSSAKGALASTTRPVKSDMPLAATLLVSPAPDASPAPASAVASRTDADSADDSETSAGPSASSDIPVSPGEPAPSKLQPFVSPCSADEVLPRISANVREFVDSINRITATEFMNFERRSHKGRLEEKAQNKASYVAIIQPLDSGFLAVDEYRNGSPGMTGFPGHIASTGSAALVLIFHPIHLDEFSMNCEGLLTWHDIPVYVITFQQRLDRPNTMSEFRAGSMSYNIYLKGTAFVDPETFQILHLDTDLLKPIPELTLDVEHQSIDYGPVAFASHNDNLWLPQLADITVRYHNKEFNERHAYSDYRLFLVETGQKISKPTVSASHAN